MTQDREEPVRAFGARLRGQAAICKLTTKCNGCQQDVTYSEAIIRDTLIAGLADRDIQLDLLGSLDQDRTLEEVLKYVEAKESGVKTASHLSSRPETLAVSSRYKQQNYQKQAEIAPSSNGNGVCTYCGGKGHGRRAPPRIRQKECKAYGHTCQVCGRLHHYGKMCRAGASDQATRSVQANMKDSMDNMETATFDSFCLVSSQHATSDVAALNHHIYDEQTNTWRRRASEAHPYLKLDISIHPEDYRQLGHTPTPTPSRPHRIEAMADTGCQISLTGTATLRTLGMRTEDLLPVKMQMSAANKAPISILGAIVARFTGIDPQGNTAQTRQMVYVTEQADKTFLSREACRALRLIPTSFPSIMETNQSSSNASDDEAASQEAQPEASSDSNTTPEGPLELECSCPRRELPPQVPSQMPYAPTEANRKKLEEYLLQWYLLIPRIAKVFPPNFKLGANFISNLFTLISIGYSLVVLFKGFNCVYKLY